MKNFIGKHKKIFIIIFALLMACVLTTTAITSQNVIPEELIDKIPTCSKPTGQVICKGIDVSSYQEEIDFAAVKDSGYDFVILRAGTGTGKDDNFDMYYSQATEAGLDVGCYLYSYATTVEEAKVEAETLLRTIKGKTFSYPVFYDFEDAQLLSYDRIETNTGMINAFCQIIKQNGYYPGVYTSSSIHKDFMDNTVIDAKWDMWIANYGDYSGDSDYYKFSNSFSMWQYTDKGKVTGVFTDVDVNLCFVDYPEIIEEFKKRLSNL